jgi:hypothetical protein
MKLKLEKSKHNKLIQDAINLLKQRQEAKWDVVRIALKVCFFNNKKGHVPKGMYSITNMANDIGMSRKTLSCWILDYETVYKCLNIDDSKMNFSERKKFSGAISRTRATLFNFNEDSRSEVINKISNERVREVFNGIIQRDPLINRLEDFIKNIAHHHYTFSNEKFNKSHSELIAEYRKNINGILEILNYMKEFSHDKREASRNVQGYKGTLRRVQQVSQSAQGLST